MAEAQKPDYLFEFPKTAEELQPKKLIRPKQDGCPMKGGLDKGQEKDKTEHVSIQDKNENH